MPGSLTKGARKIRETHCSQRFLLPKSGLKFRSWKDRREAAEGKSQREIDGLGATS
jgi:hypothetical protein